MTTTTFDALSDLLSTVSLQFQQPNISVESLSIASSTEGSDVSAPASSSREGDKENIPFTTSLGPPHKKSKKNCSTNTTWSTDSAEETTSGGPARVRRGRAQRRATIATPWVTSVGGRRRMESEGSLPASPDSSTESIELAGIEGILGVPADARAKELTESPLADITSAYDQSVIDRDTIPFLDAYVLAAIDSMDRRPIGSTGFVTTCYEL